MQSLISKLATDFPQLKFAAGHSFYYSPGTHEIFYRAASRASVADKWSLLHEVSHAALGHASYATDLELVQLEVAAWEKACNLAKKYDLKIDEDYKQDCIDTYRDWLYRRSVCPNCGTQNLQSDIGRQYQCFNCHSEWHVSNSRFSRPYRRNSKGAAPKATNAVIFI
jgi:predicted Zn-ribbon and HTH transcriptional regulator